MSDMIVEEVRRIREELIARYGGIEGYFKHCQDQERSRTRRSQPRIRKSTSSKIRNSTKERKG
jgi:hypothetical protein